MTSSASHRRLAAMAATLVAASLAAGCAPPNGPARESDLGAAPLSEAAAASATADTKVPDLVDQTVELVDKEAFAAGLVPIIEHRVDAGRPAGTVISVDPPAGTGMSYASVVTVVVAGPPGATLDDQIRARRRTFVGLAAGPDGTVILALAAGVDREKALDEVRPFLPGRRYRVVGCGTSWVALEQTRVQLSRRDFLPPGDQRAFATTLDPAGCAIRLQGDFSEAEMAALGGRFGPAVIVERGESGRAPRR